MPKELKPGYEPVFTVEDYYDGPRKGIASYRGKPHFFECIFDKAKDNYSEIFQLTRLNTEILELAMEDWNIWRRWELAYHTGKTDESTHPALPQDSKRHAELKQKLQRALASHPKRALTRVGQFEVLGQPNLPKGVLRPLQVRWVSVAKWPAFRLADAMRAHCYIRLERQFETSPVRGYVLDVGPSFFLFALVSDRIHFDGFECFLIKDIKSVEPDPYTTFVEAALKKRRERKPRKPPVSVASIEKLLLSASCAFPLLTIHTEMSRPDVCWIGRVLGVKHGRVSMLEIAPDANWDSTGPSDHRLSEITRVNFGGDYENALYLVGGKPKHHQR